MDIKRIYYWLTFLENTGNLDFMKHFVNNKITPEFEKDLEM